MLEIFIHFLWQQYLAVRGHTINDVWGVKQTKKEEKLHVYFFIFNFFFFVYKMRDTKEKKYRDKTIFHAFRGRITITHSMIKLIFKQPYNHISCCLSLSPHTQCLDITFVFVLLWWYILMMMKKKCHIILLQAIHYVIHTQYTGIININLY